MDPTRYAPGGDIYQDLADKYGEAGANQAYNASLMTDGGAALRFVLSDLAARSEGRKGGYGDKPLADSTAGQFFDQITTDPLAAPLDAANRQIGKAVWNVIKNPFVLLVVVVIAWQLGWFKKLIR
jgi:hypothetical protein